MKVSLEILDSSTNAPNAFSFIDLVKDATAVVSFFVAVLTLVGLFLGLNYIHSLRNNKRAAIFSYWTQLNVRLTMIQTELKREKGLINNFYDSDTRNTFATTSPPLEKVKKFKEIVDELGEYIKTTKDQMPAFQGWIDDYGTLIEFIANVDAFDISDSKAMFVSEDFPKRDKYYETICSSIANMSSGIKKEQVKIEKKICSRRR